MEVGNRIKELRKTQNINQDELAEKLFVSRQTISNWENDKS
ncbi:MAG: helix-turn-helix domain-containing protein [Lachnospiraceae bacterium]|nr:helix-turn-helix domain-containing protein [Lachnospiraceae bacterium]